MQNFYDVWSVILDDRGMPLHGRISFYEANTTTLKTIYDVDGNELSNPIYCNKVPTAQVILDDADYTVRFERYIGNGNMETDHNEESWFLYKTELYKLGKIASIITADSITVSTIEDLKNLTNIEDGQVVSVLGYFKAGDCPAREYVWHSEGTYTPDGGCIIRSSSSTIGGWELIIPSTYIDVRWFGDFPDSSSKPTEQKSNVGQRAAAARAATTYHKDLYFPNTKVGQKAYYIFDGSNTVSVSQNIICDNGVNFVTKEGTVGTKIVAKEIKKNDKGLFVPEVGSTSMGSFTIEADWIKTSWLYSKYSVASGARVGYIVDELYSPLTFENATVKFEIDRVETTCRFVNCDLVDCYKKLASDITMENMAIKTDWFVDDYNWNRLQLFNVTVLLQNCKDGDTYILLKNKTLDYNYGDLGEAELHNAEIHTSCVLENCTGSVRISSNDSGTIELHNASLTFNGTGGQNISLNAVDSWLTMNTDSVFLSIASRRGSLLGSGKITVLSALGLDNIEVYNELNLAGVNTCKIENSNIFNRIILFGNSVPEIRNNIFESNSEFIHSSDRAIIDGYYDKNYFKAGSKGLVVTSTVQNTVVNTKWTNNTSDMSTHFITLYRGNLNSLESAHGYTYENNSGENVAQQRVKWTDDLRFVDNKQYTNFTSHNQFSRAISEYGGTYSNRPYYFGGSRMKTEGDGTTDPEVYTTQFTMFTVGTELAGEAFSLKSGIVPVIEILTGVLYFVRLESFDFICSSEEDPVQGDSGLPKNIMWSDGYTWRLYNIPLCYLNVNTQQDISTMANYGHDTFTFTFEGELIK